MYPSTSADGKHPPNLIQKCSLGKLHKNSRHLKSLQEKLGIQLLPLNNMTWRFMPGRTEKLPLPSWPFASANSYGAWLPPIKLRTLTIHAVRIYAKVFDEVRWMDSQYKTGNREGQPETPNGNTPQRIVWHEPSNQQSS